MRNDIHMLRLTLTCVHDDFDMGVLIILFEGFLDILKTKYILEDIILVRETINKFKSRINDFYVRNCLFGDLWCIGNLRTLFCFLM